MGKFIEVPPRSGDGTWQISIVAGTAKHRAPTTPEGPSTEPEPESAPAKAPEGEP